MLRKSRRIGASADPATKKVETEDATNALQLFFVLPENCKGDVKKAPEHLQSAYSSYCQHWDKAADEESIISEGNVSKLSKSEVNQNKIFILADFNGETFEHLKKIGASILGPRCIVDCLTNDIPIPISKTPIFTIAMHGLKVSLSGPTGEFRNELKTLIGYMGGVCYEELNSACTHLVANTVSSSKYEMAAVRKLKIMSYEWVFEVWQASCERNCHADDEEFAKRRLPTFFRLYITSTGLSAKAREQVKSLITQHGGFYEGAFSSERTQILILEKHSVNSPKFLTAVKYKKECLTPQWVFDSIEQGYALAFDQYRVTASMRVSTPTKEFMQASSSDFNPNSTQLSDISHAESLRSITIDETTSSSRISFPTTKSSTTVSSMTKSADSRQSEPTYKTALAKINMSLAKKFPGFLDGCKVYLSGFNSDAKDKLIKVLNVGGAIRYEDLNDQITHVFVGKHVPSDMMMIETKNLHPNVLTLNWLAESLLVGEPLPTEKFVYKQTSNEIDIAGQPSPASKKAIISMNHSFKRPVAPPKFSLATTSKTTEQSLEKDIEKLPKSRESTSPENVDGHLMDQYLVQHENMKELKKTRGGRKDPIVDTDDLEELTYFRDKSVFLFGFDGETLESLILDCEQAKACIVDEFCHYEVDYVITPVILPNQEIPVRYKNIVSEAFIETAIQANKCPDKLEYYHYPIKYSEDDPKPLAGENISFSVYAGNERIYISNIAEILGAKEEEKFYKRNQPILIVPKPTGTKFEAAIKWGLSAVSAQWLLKCFETKTRVPMEPYIIKKPEIQKSDDENTTLKNDISVKNDESQTLINPAVVPSSTADEIDLHNTSAKESEMNSSKDCREFRDDCDKFSQNLLLKFDSKPDEEKEENDFVIKHRRLSELQKDTKKIRPQSPDSANTSNISSNLNDLDLDTPAKTLVKKVLREETAKDSPNTKRLKQCMQTPGLRELDSPVVPKCIETPDASYPHNPDETPNTRLNNKRKFDVLDTYVLPSKERRKSTPFSEIRKRFWKNALGDDYDEEQPNDTQTSLEAPNENASPKNSNNSNEYQSPNASKGLEKVIKQFTPKALAPVPSTSSTPVRQTDPFAIINSPAVLQDDGLSKIADFIKNRVLNEKNKSADSSAHIRKKRMYEAPVVPAVYQVNTEILNAGDSQDVDVGWKVRPKRTNHSTKKFMFTSMSDENKPKYAKLVEQLGGQCLNMPVGFDNACTHLVFERPNRGEKVMAAIAAGRWCLLPKYLDDSAEAGKFLNEEDYEWGNPKALHKVPTSSDIEQSLANSCHNWRMKTTSSPHWIGAFQRFRVILHVPKRDAFKRIVIAGGGTVYDISEPYCDNPTALDATHCFVDGKSCTLSDKDKAALKKAGVKVLTINFIYAYLNNENVNVDKFSASLKSPPSENT